MNHIFKTSKSNLSGQILIFGLSLLDDALLIGFSQVGLHFAWLHWLSPLVIGCMIVYWVGQFFRNQS